MSSIYRIIIVAIIIFCLFNNAVFGRPSISAEREVLKAEIKHETHKLRMLRELLTELENKSLPVQSRARRHRTLSHKDDCYFHPVTC